MFLLLGDAMLFSFNTKDEIHLFFISLLINLVSGDDVRCVKLNCIPVVFETLSEGLFLR